MMIAEGEHHGTEHDDIGWEIAAGREVGRGDHRDQRQEDKTSDFNHAAPRKVVIDKV